MTLLPRDKSRWALWLIWTCFILRGLFYSFLFPVWEGFDEFSHFAFVQHLAEGGSLPTASTPVSREIEESLRLAPLPWLLRDAGFPHSTHEDYWRLPEEARRQRQQQLGAMPRIWASQPSAGNAGYLAIWEAQQPPLYYWLASRILRLLQDFALPARVVALRLANVLLASLVIPLGYVIGRSVFARPEAALGVAALIAVMPELAVDVCRVSNESLGIVLYSLLVYAAFRFVENPGRPAAVALLAACMGLGLLTKAYFLTAVPALLSILLVCGRAGRRKPAVSGALALTVALLISGWWYGRNRLLTGSWSGLMQDVELREVSLRSLLRRIPDVDWRNAIDTFLFSHIWFGNWSFLQVRSWIYHAFYGVIFLSAAGLLALWILPALNRTREGALLRSRSALFIPLAFYGFFLLGLAYHVLITFVANKVPATPGWYAYCLVAAESVLLLAGLCALAPGRLRSWVTPAVTAGVGLLDLYTIHFLFIPYYTGLIAHRADGMLAAFQLRNLDVRTVLDRLIVNKPWLGSPGFLLIWAAYLAATLSLIVISLCAGRLWTSAVSHSQSD